MINRLAATARDLATWPIRLTHELVEFPSTLRNIRFASQRIGPALEQVSRFASRADGMIDEIDATLSDLGAVAKTLGALTNQARLVNDQWRRTMGRMPIVGRVAAELERSAAQLAAADDDEPADGDL